MDPVFLNSLLQNVLFIPVFVLAVVLVFYIPGKVALKDLLNKRSAIESVTIAIIIGMVFWGLQGIILGYLNMRYLSYFYIFMFLVFFLKKKTKNSKSPKVSALHLTKLIKSNILFLIIFVIGIFGQIQQFFISGFIFSDGIHMFTGSSDDAFWHTALINQLVSNFPPVEPGLSGELVKNYHYISNLIIADLIRVFHLPLMPTQYQFVYFFLSLLIGLAAFTLGKSLDLSKKGLILIVFLQYFSSDIIYLVSYLGNRTFEFTVHPLEDGTMFLENPPRAFASIVSLAVVIILVEFLKKKDRRSGILLALVSGIVIGLKVHHGFLILSGLAALSLYFLIKKQFKELIYPLLAVVISLLIYLPVNSGAGMPVFVLFDMPRMFAGQEKLGLSHFELARQIYEQHSNWIQVLRMYLIMFAFFIIGQFGIKNIGLLPFRRTITKLTPEVAIFLYGGIISTIILGTFFIQPVAGADIFNFYLSASLFLGVITAVTLDRLLNTKSRAIFICLLTIILILTLPRWVYKTAPAYSYFVRTVPVVSSNELDAMEFARTTIDRDALMLVFNSGKWDSMYPYVSAFADKKMFLSGQVILGRHGINIKNRQDVVKSLMDTKSNEKFSKILSQYAISHLYFYGEPKSILKITTIPGKKIFYNNDISIFQIN